MDGRETPIIGAVPSTQEPRYAGKGTFARIADINEVGDYDIAVLGVPFDGGTSYRPGARFGPLGVRQAARALRRLGPHQAFSLAGGLALWPEPANAAAAATE